MVNVIIQQMFDFVNINQTKIGKNMKKNHTLELLRSELGINKKEFAQKLGITQNSYTNYITGKRELPTDVVLKIKQLFDINIDWLLTGKGNMYNTKTQHSLYKIPILSLQASAGSGIHNYEIEDKNIIYLPKKIFKTPQKEENLKIIEVIGDSMEPTIKDGSYVIIDTSKKELIDGGIYAINLDNQILIKRLQKIPNGIKIISDNKNYSDIIYNPQETNINFHIIGKKIMQITP